MAIGTERLSSKPTAPKTGYDILYTKAGKLYMEDSNGLETEISGGTGPGGVQNNFGAAVAPTTGDDSDDGYAIGSMWLDTTSNRLYMAKSVAVGAASWMLIAVKNNFTATTYPQVTDDIAAGYSIGSIWTNQAVNATFVARDVTAGAAVWRSVGIAYGVSNTAPTANQDVDEGYAVGSTWYDYSADKYYVCDTALADNAVWKEIPVTGTAWDIGAVEIRALTFQSDEPTNAPFTVASSKVVTNLNADTLDGNHASAFITSLSGAVLANGTVPLTADWDAGGYEIRAQTFESDVATNTAPFVVASETKVTNLNADKLDDRHASGTHGVYTIPISSQYTGQIADDFVLNAGGSREQNRIGNYGAEIDTAGWATYADAAGAAPVNGTGGSPTVTWTRTTTTPLRGDGAFLFTKDAANRQGEGASYDFTIENTEQTAVFKVAFDYAITSGTYATGDLTVYLYDVTNGVVIQPSSYQIATGTTSLPFVFEGYFQAPISVSYRLIIHVASTSSSAYTLQFDGIRVAVEPQIRGPIVTDWVAYTPTGAWTSNTTYTGMWRRVGDEMECRVKIATSGAPTSAELYINLPTGYTIDATKIIDTTGRNATFGTASILDSGTNRYAGYVIYYTSGAVGVSAVVNPGGSYMAVNTPVTQAVPMTWAANDVMNLWFKVPISGWSSNVVLSSDADVRTVEASYYISASTANAKITNAAQEILDFDTKIIDTHNAVTTGANWTFTAPISGYYIVTSTLRMSATTPAAASSTAVNYIYVNGALASSAATIRANQTTASVNYSSQCTGIQYVGAGGTIQIYGYQSLAGGTTELGIDTSATYYNFVHIIRMGGPQTITPVETVHAHYQNSAGTSLADGKETSIPWASKVIDTHNGMNTSTGVYTIPIGGVYYVSATCHPLGLASYTVDSTIVARNAAGNEIGRGIRTTTPAGSYAIPSTVNLTERFSAGDSVVIKIYQDNTNSSAITLEATATSNQFFIMRLGL